MSASQLPSPTSSPFPGGSDSLCSSLGALALPSSHQQVPRLLSPLQPSAAKPPTQIYCHALKPRLSTGVSVSQRPLIDLFYHPLAKALWPRPPRWRKGLPKAFGAPLAHPGPRGHGAASSQLSH